MRYYGKIKRGDYVTKSTILTKQIMLGVIGWRYTGKSFLPFDLDIPRNENNERVNIGKTMQEAESFCLRKYIEFYEMHPEEHDWLPDPYNRKKVKSEIIIIKKENKIL